MKKMTKLRHIEREIKQRWRKVFIAIEFKC